MDEYFTYWKHSIVSFGSGLGGYGTGIGTGDGEDFGRGEGAGSDPNYIVKYYILKDFKENIRESING
jgi:hypothetical protein